MAHNEEHNAKQAENVVSKTIKNPDDNLPPSHRIQAHASSALINENPQESQYKSSSLMQAGQIIKGRYQIEKLIGHGGMCDVYQATDLLLKAAGVNNPFVALKILQNEHLNQPGAAKILIREAQKTQQLSHPNIIRVYDFGADKTAHYLVMEWLDGETLEEVIKRSRPNGLNYPSAMKLLKQIVSALQYAHSQGMVHADLKPSNIMLNRDGTIKIFDFGVSKALNLSADIYSAEIRDETNILCGYTPTYASPEMLKGEEPSVKDDIFAFSCIAYEMLTSKHPFNRKPADLAERSQENVSKPTNLKNSKWRVLKQGLEFDPSRRISNFDDFTKQINTRYWPQLTAAIAFCAVATATAYGFHLKNAEIKNLTAQIQSSDSNTANDSQFANLTPEELLNTVNTFPESKALFKDGLLRKHREQIIEIYEQKINTILNQKDRRYPDYYEIKKELNTIQQFYPDSLLITTLTTEISNSWQATADMLSERINTLLEQGNYASDSKGNDIYQLIADLGTVKKDYAFTPSAVAESTFTKRYNKASDNRDLSGLSEIIRAGNLMFPQQSDLLASAVELKDAVQQIDTYYEHQKQGQNPEFPYQAADLFYQNQFDNLNARLRKVRTVNQLDKLNGDVNKQTETLPEDFSPLIQIRLAMATRYLEFSDQFLQAKRERTASAVMKKANGLFAKVEQARSRSSS
ncbi:serine/threonine-protein kinase [Photobacterium sp. J15]|uniref:serine/threonine-protein kinase n=1 Tax=Photobacterium sp. J15 TaxID=265901 RepID=UPI0007E44D52|nr:serine/threonine-protein kinase [Photobacterium sp. J15]